MAATGPYPASYDGGGPPDPHARPQSAYVTSAADSLKLKALESITLSRWSSLDTILDEAAKSNIHVNTGIGFGRPDKAYLEWMKCEEYIKLILQSSSNVNMNEEKRRKLVIIQRTHEEQRPKIREIEQTLGPDASQLPASLMPASNSNSLRNSFASSQSSSRQSVYGGILQHHHAVQIANRYPHDGNADTDVDGAAVPPSLQSGQRGDYDLNGAGGRSSASSPPLSLRSQDDPIMARFSQLRSPTLKDRPNGRPKPAIPNSLMPARPVTPTGSVGTNGLNGTDGGLNASNGSPRPSGPRLMPRKELNANKELPSTPPQLSTRALLDSLPRAPSPIYAPVATTQNPAATPPRTTSMAYSNPRAPPPARDKPPFPELGDPNAIEPERLFDLLKSYKLLLIDVRARETFDDGHIHAKSIVCVEPISLKPGQSLDQLEETLLYAPDDEVNNFRRIVEYDLVVFYDQNTSNARFLQGPPKIGASPHMRYLYDSLTEFNFAQPLQRPPAFLVGGIDGWVDIVSLNALQSSRTAPSSGGQRPQRRRTTRASIIGANSSREVKAHRLATYRPMNAEEEQKWRDQVKTEELAPTDIRQFAKQVDGESASAQAESELFLPIQSMDDFFRRYPDPNQIRQSMTSPAPSGVSSAGSSQGYSLPHRPPPPSSYVPPQPPPPPPPLSIPSRPPPIASRPSYSGVSDRRPVPQQDPQRLATRPPPPIYQSRYLAHNLKLPRTGLKNFGVTCYMNSTVQCLNATMGLSRFFLDETWRQFVVKNWKGSNGIMPEIFANLIRGLWRNESAAVRPTSFRNFCNRLNSDWGSGVQQDSKEFLEFLIDTLHEDFNDRFSRSALRPLTEEEERTREELGKRQMNKVSRREWDRYAHRERSYISSLFAGQHASQLRCTTCQRTSTTYEAFYSISVEIPHKGETDVRSCLQSYCKEEQLSGDEEWRCPNCRCTRVATKRIIITRLPQILVIHFKRFSAGKGESTRKVHTKVDFPLHGLDMQPYMANTYIPPGPEDYPDPAITPPFLYDCYAVMRHIGSTGNAGHYTALCRDAARGCWRDYSDDTVTDFNPANLRSSQSLQNEKAYIVFYERAAPR